MDKFTVETTGPYAATLNVTHKCGHSASYGYGGAEFAQDAGLVMASMVCIMCANNSILIDPTIVAHQCN